MKLRIIEVTSLDQAGLELFTHMTDAKLTDSKLEGRGLFMAESVKVIQVALNAGYEPTALLMERKHVKGDAAPIIERIAAIPGEQEIPVYVGEREVLAGITGYALSRAVICCMHRRPLPTVEEVLNGAHRVVVLDDVCDTTNIGAIFRSAAALDIDAVLLTPTACDPLNRRAVRVSMANIFLLPWTWLPSRTDYPELLRQFGFKTVAMALTDKSIGLDDPVLKQEPRLAIVMGTEGDGLPHETIMKCDYTVRIPMAHGVDSLNVAAASAVAFWELRKV